MYRQNKVDINNILTTTSKINSSLNYLIKKRDILSPYNDIEELVIHSIDSDDNNIRGIIHHMENVRFFIARKLWENEIFIGTSIIDTLIFWAFRNKSIKKPYSQIIQEIKQTGMSKPGFVLYPLHSFGIAYFGISNILSDTFSYFIDKNIGIAITPQTNSDKILRRFLEDTVKELSLKDNIPYDILYHFKRTRGLKWLTKNPLFILKINSISGDYYENQIHIKTKLQFAMSYILMLGSLSNSINTKDKGRIFSTSSINNWETYDIHHYLVFQTNVGKSKEFHIKCVPLNALSNEMIELSDMNIDYDPKEWKRRPSLESRTREVLVYVQSGYLKHSMYGISKSSRSRFYRKMYTSLIYFKRSFRESSYSIDSIINLAIAFETLLTDFFYRGIHTATIISRLKLILKGTPGIRKKVKVVEELFASRGSLLHKGNPKEDVDLNLCRNCYALAFLNLIDIVMQAPSFPRNNNQIIGELLNDIIDDSIK